MPKAYWIVQVEVHDAAAYDTYRAAVAAPLGKYGAKFIVRAGAQEVREGASRPRTVVIEFPDLASATACYDSADYQAVKTLRDAAAEADLVIVEGYGD